MANAEKKAIVFELLDKAMIEGSSRPSLNMLRDAVGGASPNDVHAWVKEWKEQNPAYSGVYEKNGFTQTQAQAFLNGSWNVLKPILAEYVNEVRKELVNNLKDDTALLNEAKEMAFMQSAEATRRVAEMDRERQEWTDKLAQQQRDYDAMRSRHDVLQKRYEDCLNEIAELRAKLSVKDEEIKNAYAASLSQSRSENAALAKEIDATQSENGLLRSNNETLQKVVNDRVNENATL